MYWFVDVIEQSSQLPLLYFCRSQIVPFCLDSIVIIVIIVLFLEIAHGMPTLEGKRKKKNLIFAPPPPNQAS